MTYDDTQDLISYYDGLAQDALDSSEYAETDDEIENCMATYFSARNMSEMIAYIEKNDIREPSSF